MSVLGEIGVAVAKKGFGELFSKLIVGAMQSGIEKIGDALKDTHSVFEPHLKATFDRCTKIRTLLNRDEPAELLAQYVNLTFTCGDKTWDDYDFIEEIWKRKRIIISAGRWRKNSIHEISLDCSL